MTLISASGRRQAAEIYAGSSFASQSTAAALFGYTDSDPAVRLAVRWPDGAKTEAAVAPATSGVITLSAP